MMQYAQNREFERADEMKKRIFALTHINDIALMKNSLETRTSHLEPNFRIEAYDIAHMGGKNMVGVMTVVEDGQAAKHEYKKFRIRSQDNANDTGALKEVLERRLAHDEWTHPSLIVMDGGIAQLNVAMRVLKSLRVHIPVVAVVKDERHKPKAISGDEKLIRQNKSAILLANSEAHRFAIAYHKNMRNKNFQRNFLGSFLKK
jgi:excinuclease ABC subunit C